LLGLCFSRGLREFCASYGFCKTALCVFLWILVGRWAVYLWCCGLGVVRRGALSGYSLRVIVVLAFSGLCLRGFWVYLFWGLGWVYEWMVVWISWLGETLWLMLSDWVECVGWYI